MTSRTFIAISVSLLVHGLLVLAFAAYLKHAPEPEVLATLDLSSVELSFSEKAEETAAARPMPAAPAAKPLAQPKAERPPEPELEKPLPKPPEPETPGFREPPEMPSRLETPGPVDGPAPSDSPDRPAAEAVQPAPRQARVDAPPRPRQTIRPDYPRAARRRREQGDVVLEICVNAEGTVDDAKVVQSSGFADLDAAAVKAARGARFVPARSGRESVASTARLKLEFRLK